MDETLKALREQRAALMAKADAIVAGADSREEKRLTGEESQEFDRIWAEAGSLHDEIARREKHEQFQRELAGVQAPAEKPQPETTPAGSAKAFRTWCRAGGSYDPSDEERREARAAGFSTDRRELTFSLPTESRAMGAYETTKGAKAIPEGFVASLEAARLAFGDVRSVATVLRTATGNPLPMPTANDTGNTGRLLAENTQVTPTDVVIANLTLDAYKFSSDVVLVSEELLQDEEIGLEGWLGRMLGERLGRVTNSYFTTGTGSSQPNGIVTASTLQATVAGDDAVTYAELVNLMHSVDPAYQDGAAWMFNFATLGALKKLVDADQRPLWQHSMTSGLADGVPSLLLGKPYKINQQMASMVADAKSILYGDFSKYIVREVKDVTLRRLDERYADYHQVAFLASMRCDGDLLDAGTNPVKCIRQAGS